MIVNFYLRAKLLAQKNIEAVPNFNDYVLISGQAFYVVAKEFDFNKQYEQCNIHLKRCSRYNP